VYFSSSWQVLEEDVPSQPPMQYVWSPVYVDALVERENGSGRLYSDQDANWNTTALVNTTGTVVERYTYDPYGKVNVLDNNWNGQDPTLYAERYLFQGGRYDTTTGLYNYRNRDQSPTLGRWLRNDPLGFGGGDTNLYRYVNNGPTHSADPSGLSRMDEQVLPDGRVALYYIGTQFAFWDQAPVWIGNYDPLTGLVQRGNDYVAYERVRQAATAWGIGSNTMPDWSTWFPAHAVETRPGQMGQGVLRRMEVGQDFRNEAAIAEAHIRGLAETAIWHLAGAGFAVRIAGTRGLLHSFEGMLANGSEEQLSKQTEQHGRP
jgi:RHS repeat-associated protein